MTATDPVLEKLRRICLALPNTKETPTWGHPHFRVGEKIFTGYGQEYGNNRPSISAKVTMDEQQALIAADPDRFFVPPYVGKKGWVGIYMDGRLDWSMVETLVEKSYRNVAKVRDVKALDEMRATTESVGVARTSPKKSAPRSPKAVPKAAAPRKKTSTRVGRSGPASSAKKSTALGTKKERR